MELVAFLGGDVESWGQVSGLINNGSWDSVVIVRSSATKSFSASKPFEEVVVDTSKPLVVLREEIISRLKGKFAGFDAHLSIASGNGKEHMALISALLSIPVGIRLVVFTKKGVEVIN